MKSKNMDNRENFSALSTLSPGSNGVRSFSSPGGINGKRTPVTKKLIIKNLKVSPKISTYISWLKGIIFQRNMR